MAARRVADVQRSFGLALAMVLGWWRCAFALDPALDIAQYAHTAWKTREGFGNGGVLFAIAQTTDGYIWLGGQSGLVRFDGVRSVVWEPPGGQRLPDQHISSLVGAHDGTLWIGTWKGLASWKAGKLTSYPQPSAQVVTAMVEDYEGNLWVASGSVDPSSPAMLCTVHGGDSSCNPVDGRMGHVISLHEDAKQQLWAITSNRELWRLRPGTPKPQALDKPVSGNRQGFAEDGEGGLLIAVRGGITRLIEETGASTLVALPEVQPSALLRDRDGGVWIATYDSDLLHMHNGRTDTFRKSDGLSGEPAYSMLEDREGSIWVTTVEGIDRFRNLAAPTISVRQGLSSPAVGSILKSQDGSVWISTNGGLNRWHNGEITVYRAPGGGERHAKSPTASERSLVREIHVPGLTSSEGALFGALFEDSKGRIWIATEASIGFLENDDRYVKLDGISQGFVDAITQDLAGDLWFAHRSQGLLRVSAGRMVDQIPWERLSRYGTASSLAADPKERGLWLGFLLGGVAHLAHGEIRESYSAANGLAGGRVYYLRAEPDGALWIGAEGGLSRLKQGHIATLNRSSGLPCDSVDWMVDDDLGAVWVYTACGIAQIDRSELNRWALAADRGGGTTGRIRATVFDNSDGVRRLETPSSFSPHVARSSDGKVWFVTQGGVGVLDPHHLPKNTLRPPVHIEQIIADRKIHDAEQALSLPPLVRDLEIDYTALSLVSPEKNQFRYQLEGHDRDWQNVGTRRQALYGDLPPGRYRFRVIASNNSGVWNTEGAALDFSVAPAYWQMNWFRALCAAAFLGLLWLLYVLRLQQVKHVFNVTLEARVAERTRIARDLHDSLLQGFQGLMFRLQAVRELLPPGHAAQILDSAMQLGDQAIGAGREAVQNLRSSSLNEGDLATSLGALGAELEGGVDPVSKPEYRVVVEGSPRELNAVVRDDAYHIAREAVRNAYKHAKAGHIETEITFGNEDLIIRVRDDGIGVDPQILASGQQAGHWGLPGMRERTESVGGRLRVWSEANAGTEIELRIPANGAYARRSPSRSGWIRRLLYPGERLRPNAGRRQGSD